MKPTGESLLHSWGVAPTASVWIGGNNLDARSEIEAVAESLRASPEAAIDCAFITPKVVGEAAYFAEKLRARLVSGASVWVAWRALDTDGLAAVSAALSGGGFEEFGRVPLSVEFVTVGFRQRC